MRNVGSLVVAISACCAFLLLYVPSERYPIRDVDAAAADSAQYHFIALNLLQGKGYRSRPVGPIEAYGEFSRRLLARPIQTPLEDRMQVAAHRGPGYPLFLAAIYALHGPRPDVVIHYQAILAGLTGVLLVLIAKIFWGDLVSVGGVVAAVLLRHQDEMKYATSALLTECLAAFLLTLAVLCALWAKRGGARRELVMGVLMAAIVLTRQALLGTALFYGFFLLFPLKGAWKRALAYAIPCVIAFTGWTLFLSTHSGDTVVMASTGFSSFLNGLDPVACATANGVQPPSMDPESLAAYWGGSPIAETPGLRQDIFRRLPSRIPEVLYLIRVRLKIAFFWLPQSLVWCILVGTALVSMLAISRRDHASEADIAVDAPLRQRTMTAALAILALVLVFFILGYSNPALPALGVAGLAAAVAVSLVAQARGSLPSRLWIASWPLGYLGMTLLTIGVRRYIRPYLPVLYLLAVAAIPLAVVCAAAVMNGTFRPGGRTLRFRWHAAK
ncbi:MAG: hypothetical protein ACXW5U_04525 [Thermoanaerobaculia bacterium]